MPMSKHWKGCKNIVLNVHELTINEHKDYYEICKRLVRITEHSNPENFKKPSVLSQILRFL